MPVISRQAGGLLALMRPDVEFLAGPDAPDGSPTYIIHDPLRGSFDKATWTQAEILHRLRTPQTAQQLVEQLRTQTTIRVTTDDIEALCADAQRKRLTRSTAVDGSLAEGAWHSRRDSGLSMWFRRLAFARIPLIRPDRFLERTVGLACALATPAAMALYLLFLAAGMILLIQRFDEYTATFLYFFNLRGALTFMLAVAAVKTIHEFSHAYVAKALGNRVPTMGIVLIFLFPIAFADVTDSWRMRSRRKRLLIALAGVIAETVVAGIALFVWGLSPPGGLRSVSFVLSSVTLMSTLIVNLNPLMRYDGYYVLSDLLCIDNLQSRSFAVTRWVVRRHLLGIQQVPPEHRISLGRAAFMLAYAVAACTYRLFLYAGIAWMLYRKATKLVGVVLFFVAIYMFLVKPVIREMKSLYQLRHLTAWNSRTVTTAVLGGAALLWAMLPLSRWRAVPAVTVAQETQVIYAPGSGAIRRLAVGQGSAVRKGQTLFVLESLELENLADLARLDLQRINTELTVVKHDAGKRALLPQKMEELARATAKLDSVLTALDGNRFVARIDGVVAEWDESLREGTMVAPQNVLGRIVHCRGPRVACYVPSALLPELTCGIRVSFCPDAQPRRMTGIVSFVSPVRTLTLDHPGLSSLAGGDIAVTRDGQGALNTLDSRYKVEVTLEESAAPVRIGQTGRVWLRTSPRPRIVDWLGYGYQVLLRESGF